MDAVLPGGVGFFMATLTNSRDTVLSHNTQLLSCSQPGAARSRCEGILRDQPESKQGLPPSASGPAIQEAPLT